MKPIRPQPPPRAGRAAAAALEDCRFFLTHEMRSALIALDMALARAGKDAGAGVDPARLAKMNATLRSLRTQSEALAQLMDLARRPFVLRAIDLSAIFERAADQLRQRFPDRVVQVEVEAGMRCTGDAEGVSLLARCLLDNAWKFTADTPQALVRVGVDGAGGHTGSKTGMLQFHVTDNGAGFDPECAAVLFQAFRRLHPAKQFPGEGTGLALVRTAVERHGGRVEAQGAPGQGCRIGFSLPAPPA